MKTDRALIISFGIPRSGTTFIQEWLTPVKEWDYVKLGEANPLHPVQETSAGKSGLIGLRHLFRHRPVLFVYSERNELDIFRSFWAAKMIVENGLRERNPAWTKGIAGIAKNVPDKVWRFIDNTRRNTDAQDGATPWGEELSVDILRINYDTLADDYIAHIATLAEYVPKKRRSYVCNQLEVWFGKHWGKRPVREGRLSHALKKIDLPEDLEQKVRYTYYE